jgi:transposase-like protein
MTVRDIEHHLQRTLGVELSRETISNITDAVLEKVKAWQTRPLDPVYPVVYIDALVVNVRDGGHVVNKAAHIVVGVDTDDIKHVLGIWVQSAEGAKFWLHALTELRNSAARSGPGGRSRACAQVWRRRSPASTPTVSNQNGPPSPTANAVTRRPRTWSVC